MKLEIRVFNRGEKDETRQLLLIPDSFEESRRMDYVFGPVTPCEVGGTRQLSDGFGEDYIRLEKKK